MALRKHCCITLKAIEYFSKTEDSNPESSTEIREHLGCINNQPQTERFKIVPLYNGYRRSKLAQITNSKKMNNISKNCAVTKYSL